MGIILSSNPLGDPGSDLFIVIKSLESENLTFSGARLNEENFSNIFLK